MKRNAVLIVGIVMFPLLLNSNAAGLDKKTIKPIGTHKKSLTVTDVDGNVYHTVTLGTQTWTTENLRTTKYNDSTAIPLVTDSTAWRNLTTPGYCWYNNNKSIYKKQYGALYNWYVVHTGKLAPAGWHVPSKAEWDTLQNYLIDHGYNYDGTITGNKFAKAMAAKIIWGADTTTGAIGNNLGTNNSSGFSALPGGCRSNDGSFVNEYASGYWWSTTEDKELHAYHCYLVFLNSSLNSFNFYENSGFSVRLVKD
jgi:uncharacterized protein (TIGR02145 family)